MHDGHGYRGRRVLLPPSRERSTFITLMQQAQMMANAAVAIHGDVLLHSDSSSR